MDTLRLNYLNLTGYKSISNHGQTIRFSDDVTILLGPNGAGKSNVISFFQMLNFMTTDALREFVAKQGYARSLLYYGPERTTKLTAELLFSGEDTESQVINQNYYRLTLSHAAGDQLIFTDETIEFRRITDENPEPNSAPYSLGVGHKAVGGIDVASAIGVETMRQRCRHFHEWLEKLEQLTLPSTVWRKYLDRNK